MTTDLPGQLWKNPGRLGKGGGYLEEVGGGGITKWQHSKECMCHLRNIAMRDYQESVTTGQTD